MKAPSDVRRELRRKARRRLENQFYVFTEKLRRGCELTGNKLPPEELEWHHKDPETKKAKVSRLVSRGASIQAVMAEIERCICISRELHRKLHAQETHS